MRALASRRTPARCARNFGCRSREKVAATAAMRPSVACSSRSGSALHTILLNAALLNNRAAPSAGAGAASLPAVVENGSPIVSLFQGGGAVRVRNDLSPETNGASPLTSANCFASHHRSPAPCRTPHARPESARARCEGALSRRCARPPRRATTTERLKNTRALAGERATTSRTGDDGDGAPPLTLASRR